MRTVKELLNMDGRVYVHLPTAAIMERFLMDAEKEGFTFGDGVKPTQRSGDDLYALNPDCTINYVGFIGHMAFKNPKNVIGKPLLRIDYEKYVMGHDDYVMQYKVTGCAEENHLDVENEESL